MVDDCVVFLACAGKEAGDVDERDDGNVERVAEADKAGALAAGVAVKNTGVDAGLVGYHADRLAVEASKADDDVACEVALHFHEFPVVDNGTDDLVHVVGHVGVVRYDLVQTVFFAVNGVRACDARCAFHVVLGQVAEQLADEPGEFFLRLGREMADAAACGVNAGSAEVFLGDVFTRYGFHDLRSGEEHVAYAFQHHHEVGQGRGVDSTAGARAANSGDLRNDAACFDIALEDVAEAGKGVDALLDAGAARVVQSDARSTHFERLVHDFADLFSHCLGQRTAVDCEILSEHIYQTAVDRTATGYDAVAQKLLLFHAEVVTTVQFEHIHFLEAVFVEQQVDTFARSQLAFGVLFLDRFLTAAQACLGAQLNEFFDLFQLFTHCIECLLVCFFSRWLCNKPWQMYTKFVEL